MKLSKKNFLLYGKKITLRKLVYMHILLFIIILGVIPPEKVVGVQRIITTFILLLLVAYWVTGSWKTSYILSLSVTLLLGLLDSRGVFSDYKHFFYKYIKKPSTYYQDKEGNHLWGNNGFSYTTIESFDGNDGNNKKTKSKDYSEGNTIQTSSAQFTEKELDDLLEKDKEDVEREDSVLKKAGGGLEQLHELIEKAKKDSPYYDEQKSISSYSPAQAQRATYHLVDTVKQLQDTMTQMMPLIKSGTNLLNLQKKITDVNTDDLLKTIKS